jgi:hypothetical protein
MKTLLTRHHLDPGWTHAVIGLLMGFSSISQAYEGSKEASDSGFGYFGDY